VTRHEFRKSTKQAALKRSGGICEAIGPVYGLEPKTRCTASLATGVDFDHYPKSALDDDSDGLDNCVACCRSCHRWKTSHYDVPMQAKGRRIRRQADPETRRQSKHPIRSGPTNWPKRAFTQRLKHNGD